MSFIYQKHAFDQPFKNRISLKRRNLPITFYVFVIILNAGYFKTLQADDSDLSGFSGYFYEIDQQFLGSFLGYNSLYHGLAIGSSAALVSYDIDWKYYEFFNNNRNLQYALFPAVILGGLGPISIPLYLHYTGVKQANKRKRYTAYAIGQSAALSVAISSLYKSITGRLEPGNFRETRSVDQSKQFEFGFWNNGIFHGWPSGHAMTAMAVGTSMNEMQPDKSHTHIWWTLAAVYVAFGVSTNIHWLSDAVAGSLIGYGIGKTVGRAYYKKLTNRQKPQAMILPFVGPDAVGLSFTKLY